MYTLNDIKAEYRKEMVFGLKGIESLGDYVKKNFVPMYDAELNFIGWDKK